MELKKFLLLFVFVFSTIQSVPLRTLPPIPADDVVTVGTTVGTAAKGFLPSLAAIDKKAILKATLNFLRLFPAACVKNILLPLWQGTKAHPFLALTIGGSFAYLLHKQRQGERLAAQILPLRDQTQANMTVNNNQILNMAAQLTPSWYTQSMNVIALGLVLICLALIPEQK